MILRKLSVREKGLLLSAIVILLFFVCYMLALKPAIRRFQRVNQEIALKEASLKRALLIIDKKTSIRNQYKRYAEHIRMTGSEEEEMGRFLRDIESLSAGLVSFSSIKPRFVKDLDFYKQFVVEAACKTDIKALTELIYKLEHSGKMFKVVNLRLDAKEGGTSLLSSSMLISRILISQE